MLSDGLASALPLDKFDLAVTHPPMMPAPEGISQSDHDFAGPTGREILDRIIERTPNLLNSGGRLIIGQFNFLGLEQSTGDPGCTADKLADAGMTIDEIHTYRVPASQAIVNAQEQIKDIYPRHIFEEAGGQLYHRFSVVKAKLTAST